MAKLLERYHIMGVLKMVDTVIILINLDLLLGVRLMCMQEPQRLEQSTADLGQALFVKPKLEQITLASRSEGACLYTLHKYCDFQPEMGKNMQVWLDKYRRCDFKIGNYYIEYHPTVLMRSFENKHAQYRFNKLIKKLGQENKHELQGILKAEFRDRYYNKRKLLIDAIDDKAKLITIDGQEEFYNEVIKKFANKSHSRSEFNAVFNYCKSKNGFKKVLEKFEATKI